MQLSPPFTDEASSIFLQWKLSFKSTLVKGPCWHTEMFDLLLHRFFFSGWPLFFAAMRKIRNQITYSSSSFFLPDPPPSPILHISKHEADEKRKGNHGSSNITILQCFQVFPRENIAAIFDTGFWHFLAANRRTRWSKHCAISREGSWLWQPIILR